MATRRKRFRPTGRAETPAHMYAQFVAALLAGTITAEAIIESTENGRVVLDYDDPNGA